MGGAASTLGSIGSAVGSPFGALTSGLTGAGALANAYQQQGTAQLGQQQADRTQALGLATNPQQMQQLQDSITTNNQDISRKQQLLASADPALMAAGQQALALMNGQSAASLKPLQDQRAQQRQQLQSSLSQQLGPDYATSSQGQAALNQFDQQTANTLAGAQQQAIGNYMGYANQAENAGNLGQNMQQQGNIGQQYGNVSGRQIGAIQGSPVNAGLAYQGNVMSASLNNQSMNQMLGYGGGMAYKAMTGNPGAGQTPSTPTQGFSGLTSGGAGDSGGGMGNATGFLTS